jgi:hypothetical protein
MYQNTQQIPVTIMFYALCWFNEKFQRDIVRVIEAQGIPFSYYQHLIHAPSLLLVIADAAAKHGDLLEEVIYVYMYMYMCVCFTCMLLICC